MKCIKPALPTLKPATVQTLTTGGWKPDRLRGSRHERGYDYAWEKRRLRIKARAKGLCEPHLAQGLVHSGSECDHVVSKAEARARGWTKEQIEAESNLQWVCTTYHREKTAREDSKHRGGGSK